MMPIASPAADESKGKTAIKRDNADETRGDESGSRAGNDAPVITNPDSFEQKSTEPQQAFRTCLRCFYRRTRCDGEIPACWPCRRAHFSCGYGTKFRADQSRSLPPVSAAKPPQPRSASPMSRSGPRCPPAPAHPFHESSTYTQQQQQPQTSLAGSSFRHYSDQTARRDDDLPKIYMAVYSGVDVYEMEVNNVAVMRRRNDSWLNATQILKVAGVDKGKRTKILEKDIQTGEHEKVQGDYGKYQGTWIGFEKAVEVCRQYGVEDLLRPLLTYDMGRGALRLSAVEKREEQSVSSGGSDELIARVCEWRQQCAPVQGLLVELQEQGDHPVTTLARKSCNFFQDIMQLVLRQQLLPKEIANSIRRSYEAMRIWDSDYGVSNGGLEKALITSSTVRRLTSNVLRRIARQLTEGLSALSSEESLRGAAAQLDKSREMTGLTENNHLHESQESECSDSNCGEVDSGGGSPPPGWDNAAELSRNLANDTECLMSMGLLYKNPPADPIPQEVEAMPLDLEWSAEKLYCNRISQRFPAAQEALVLRLGRANMQRYIRCMRVREGLPAQDPDEPILLTSGETPIAVGLSTRPDSGPGATLVHQGQASEAVRYARTVMSYGPGPEARNRIPPLSDYARERIPFECFLCGQQIVAFTDVMWKSHLFADLQPYICLDSTCDQEMLFTGRSQWEDHLDHRHYQDWKGRPCCLCGDDLGDIKIEIANHLRYHLEEIALACGPSIVGARSSSESAGTDDGPFDEGPPMDKPVASGKMGWNLGNPPMTTIWSTSDGLPPEMPAGLILSEYMPEEFTTQVLVPPDSPWRSIRDSEQTLVGTQGPVDDMDSFPCSPQKGTEKMLPGNQEKED